jgi:hypothetical protein
MCLAVCEWRGKSGLPGAEPFYGADKTAGAFGLRYREPRGLLGTQDDRQPSRYFGQRQVIALEGPSEDLQIEEAESAHLYHDAVRCQLLLLE